MMKDNTYISNWRSIIQNDLKTDNLNNLPDLLDKFDFKQFSRFPKIDSEGIKSNYLECFYQKVLDKDISKSYFETEEKRIHDTVSMLWVYSDIYYCKSFSKKEIKETNAYKTKKALFKKTIDKISCKNDSDDNFYPINDGNELSSLLYLGTRGICGTWLYCKDSKTLLLIDDCILLAYNINDDYELLSKIARSNGLLELEK